MQGTRVLHEKFEGVLKFIVGEGVVAGWLGVGEKTRKGFAQWNEDFKRRCDQ